MEMPRQLNHQEEALLNLGRRPDVLVLDTDAAGNYVKGQRPATRMADGIEDLRISPEERLMLEKGNIEKAKNRVDAIHERLKVLDETILTLKANSYLPEDTQSLIAEHNRERSTLMLELGPLEKIIREYDKRLDLLPSQEDRKGHGFEDLSQPGGIDSVSDSSIPGERPVDSTSSVAPDTLSPEERAADTPSLEQQQLRFMEVNREISQLNRALNNEEDPTRWGEMNRKLKALREEANSLRTHLLDSTDKKTVN